MRGYMKLLNLVVVLPVLLMAGCAMQGGSVGNPQLAESSKAELYQIINDNITTRSDARAKLGDPQDMDYNEITKQRSGPTCILISTI